MSQTLWHTINIQIPDKMLNISKTGKVTIKKPLTKTGNLSKSNKEPSIIITTNHNIQQPQIINNGERVNEAEIRTQQLKLKAKAKEVSTLKPKIKLRKIPDYTDLINYAKNANADLIKLKETRRKIFHDIPYELIVKFIKNKESWSDSLSYTLSNMLKMYKINMTLPEYMHKYIGSIQKDGSIMFNKNLVNKYNKYHRENPYFMD